MKVTRISEFEFEGQPFTVLFDKHKLSYIFEVKGERYGNAVEVDGRKTRDVVDAALNLLINFIETKHDQERRDSALSAKDSAGEIHG